MADSRPVVVLISEDPRASHRANEAMRIGLGIVAGENEVVFVLRGPAVELVIRRWEILAGTVLGAGDFGSRITLAWREIDLGADRFLPPPIDPSIISRLRDRRQTQSLLGAGVARAPSGYETQGTTVAPREEQETFKRVKAELREARARRRKGGPVERRRDTKQGQLSEQAFSSEELA